LDNGYIGTYVSLTWGDSGDVRYGFQVFAQEAARSGRGKSVHSPSLAGHQGTGASKQTGIPMICQTGSMDEARAAELMAESAAVLRKAGARFAYLHGSRAFGQYRPDSGVDIAAYFGGQPPNAFDILMPPGVDLLVLDRSGGRLPPGRFTSMSSRASPAHTGSLRPVSPADEGSPW
jgi:hypothetical protein